MNGKTARLVRRVSNRRGVSKRSLATEWWARSHRERAALRRQWRREVGEKRP